MECHYLFTIISVCYIDLGDSCKVTSSHGYLTSTEASLHCLGKVWRFAKKEILIQRRGLVKFVNERLSESGL